MHKSDVVCQGEGSLRLAPGMEVMFDVVEVEGKPHRQARNVRPANGTAFKLVKKRGRSDDVHGGSKRYAVAAAPAAPSLQELVSKTVKDEVTSILRTALPPPVHLPASGLHFGPSALLSGQFSGFGHPGFYPPAPSPFQVPFGHCGHGMGHDGCGVVNPAGPTVTIPVGVLQHLTAVVPSAPPLGQSAYVVSSLDANDIGSEDLFHSASLNSAHFSARSDVFSRLERAEGFRSQFSLELKKRTPPPSVLRGLKNAYLSIWLDHQMFYCPFIRQRFPVFARRVLGPRDHSPPLEMPLSWPQPEPLQYLFVLCGGILRAGMVPTGGGPCVRIWSISPGGRAPSRVAHQALVARLPPPPAVRALPPPAIAGGEVSPDAAAPLLWDGHYCVSPAVLQIIQAWAGVKVFARDVFADPARSVAAAFWSPDDDAFSHDWTASGTWWINPPFHCFPMVLSKLLGSRVRALILAPRWDTFWFRLLAARAVRRLDLPPRRMFSRFPGGPLLPAPTWAVSVFLWSGERSWVRDVTMDGDVERNPGPSAPPISFGAFMTDGFDDFQSSLPPQDVTRQLLLVRHRLRSASGPLEDITPTVQSYLGPLPPQCDLWRAVAVYELFSGAQLHPTPGGGWAFTIPDPPLTAEVERLRLQIEHLQAQRQTARPSDPDFSEFSESSVSLFGQQPGRPSWMRTLTEILLDSFRRPQEPVLPRIWEMVTRVHFQYTSTYPPGAPRRRNVTAYPQFTLEQAIADGGTVHVERGPKGYSTFLRYRNGRYYVSQGGRLLDTNRPPPSACDACGEQHWHWECQHYAETQP